MKFLLSFFNDNILGKFFTKDLQNIDFDKDLVPEVK